MEAVRVKDLDDRPRAWSGASEIEALVAGFDRTTPDLEHGSRPNRPRR
jgi:hypothetical protein